MDSIQPSILFLLIVILWLLLLADQYVSGSPFNVGPTAPASTPTKTLHLGVRHAQAWLSDGLDSSLCSSSLSLLHYSLYSQRTSSHRQRVRRSVYSLAVSCPQQHT